MIAQKIAAVFLAVFALIPVAHATTLDEIIEGARKEGNLRGQWGQNSFGGSEGFQEILAGMNRKYKLNLKGQYTPGPDMQRIMLRVIQEAAAGQPASTDVYLGNSQAIFDGLKANLFANTTYDKFIENKPKPEGKFNAIAPAGTHVAFATTVVGIQYNSNLVKGNDVNVLKRTGAPVAHTVVEEGTVLHMRYAAIPKNSRAPNIGALLINYLMSAEGQELLWKHDGMDLHLFPGSQTKRELDILRAAKGKIVTSSPEWLASSKNYAETQKELEGILREGGK